MKINIHSDKDNEKIIDIELKGDINKSYSGKLYDEIKKLGKHKNNNLLIDMSNAGEIDKDGYLTLGSIMAYCGQHEINFAFYTENPKIEKMINESEYKSFIKVFSNKEGAVQEILRPKKKRKKK